MPRQKYPSPAYMPALRCHLYPPSPCQAATRSSSSSTPPGLLPALPTSTSTSTWALHLPVLWLPSFILLKVIPESLRLQEFIFEVRYSRELGDTQTRVRFEVGREGMGNIYCILLPCIFSDLRPNSSSSKEITWSWGRRLCSPRWGALTRYFCSWAVTFVSFKSQTVR